MAASRQEFLNGAAVVETTLAPADLLAVLHNIESHHGRQASSVWCDRTLDLDLLLFDDQIIETPTLTVPHPRMSFRRFVLEPAAEIAGEFLHPSLGWTIAHLRQHLDEAADLAAIVSPRESERRDLVAKLVDRFGVQVTSPPAIEEAARLWPDQWTTWVRLPAAATGGDLRTSTDASQGAHYWAAHQPKLSILMDRDPAEPLAAAFVREPGRGPTLRVRDRDQALAQRAQRDAFAALEAVWPHLGP